MRFSERQGFVAPRNALQLESMDGELRTSLWNVVQEVLWSSHESRSSYSYTTHSNLYELIRLYWRDYFKIPTNDIPEYIQRTVDAVRTAFFEFEWYETYDFIEFTSSILGRSRPRFIHACNEVLGREMSGYRLVDTQIVPISSSSELEAIEEAIGITNGLAGANAHLKRALELLSDRKSPDYRNSIKESISAVEAVAQAITGDQSATLGAALKEISTKAPMHPALNKSLSSLYGYTSDSDGIRHALLEESGLDFVDAKFMLTACAAFVNYMLGKSAQTDS
ncbi:AbiJ-NTD4 domain-containing protein [Xanthomonas arboricola]|uniref:HEPN AbiJ-N-terminal domain-containing protein n=1 Tax=Xanthomonas arboricola TaxID=56448 RepID=A0AAU9HKJ4_9XANT|nr:hypothetical protein [Xanthomonas arboricola]CAE6689843.1 hypothetical protein XA1314C_01510 [Xanthomonas arboricola]CAE6689865.1 hypothetical protein XA1314C_01510 [Xanthomonas arboricola]